MGNIAEHLKGMVDRLEADIAQARAFKREYLNHGYPCHYLDGVIAAHQQTVRRIGELAETIYIELRADRCQTGAFHPSGSAGSTPAPATNSKERAA